MSYLWEQEAGQPIASSPHHGPSPPRSPYLALDHVLAHTNSTCGELLKFFLWCDFAQLLNV